MKKLVVIKNEKSKAKRIIPYIILFTVIFMAGFFGYFFTQKFSKNKELSQVIINKEDKYFNLHVRYPYIRNKEYLKKIENKVKEELKNMRENKKENTELEYNLDYKIYNLDFLCSIVFKEHKYIQKKEYEIKEKVMYYNTFTNTILSLEDLLQKDKKDELNNIIETEYLKKYNEKLKEDYIIYLDKEGLKVQINKNILVVDYLQLENILKKQYIPQETIICEYKINKEKNNLEKERNVEMFKDKKVICLTFDDGPSKYTQKLIDELNKRDAKATFFVLGSRIHGNEEILKNMASNGFQIGNHSFSHRNYHNLKENEINAEIDETNNEIKKVTGIIPKVARSPYGNKKIEILKNKNLVEVSWSIDPEDWKYRNKDHIVKHCLERIKSGDIILMHDIYETSVDAAIKIVDELKKEGYEFLTINEMIKLKNYKINYETSIKNFIN